MPEQTENPLRKYADALDLEHAHAQAHLDATDAQTALAQALAERTKAGAALLSIVAAWVALAPVVGYVTWLVVR